jgi:hypothetical protein
VDFVLGSQQRQPFFFFDVLDRYAESLIGICVDVANHPTRGILHAYEPQLIPGERETLLRHITTVYLSLSLNGDDIRIQFLDARKLGACDDNSPSRRE